MPRIVYITSDWNYCRISFIIRSSRNIIIKSSYYYNYITLLYSVILFEFQSVIKCYIKYRFKEIFFQ